MEQSNIFGDMFTASSSQRHVHSDRFTTTSSRQVHSDMFTGTSSQRHVHSDMFMFKIGTQVKFEANLRNNYQIVNAS
jgi:hypothetical protein